MLAELSLSSDCESESLLKSIFTLSAETELAPLLKKILQAALASSGAARGWLLLEEGGRLFIRAKGNAPPAANNRIVKQSLAGADSICKVVVEHVFRTGDKVILHNAAHQGPFMSNPEVQGLQLRSLLCLPIRIQAKVIGIAYLDHPSEAVFTLQKTRITEMLMYQAAISLKNAKRLRKMNQALEELRLGSENRAARPEEYISAYDLPNRDTGTEKRAEDRVFLEPPPLSKIVELLPAYLLLIKADYHVVFANRTFRELFGDPRGKRCFDHLLERDLPCEVCYAADVLKTMEPCEWEWLGPNGRYYYVFDYPFPDIDETALILEIGIDITDRIRAEEEIHNLNRELEQRVKRRTAQLEASEAHLRETLYEKEALLKEVHHRVKNNLQIIHSLLNLQLPNIKDEVARKAFRESQGRVFSMALIHEKLYESESLIKICLGEYVHSLLDNLFSSYGVSEKDVELQISVGEADFGIDTIIPCALIINELVSNSLKHAFPNLHQPGEEKNIIAIDLSRIGNRYVLRVSDNGIGLPKGFAIENSQSLGLKLVCVLVNQLKGTIEYRSDSLTKITITFDACKKQGGLKE